MQEIASLTTTVSTLNASVNTLASDVTTHKTEIASLTTTIGTLTTTVASMSDNATKQQAEIDTLKTEVVTLQTSVTANTKSTTEHRSCFLDLNSADCPTAKRRSGREIEETEEPEEQEGLVIEDYDDFDLGPHPSLILKDIFRSSRLAEIQTKFKKNKKNKNKNKKKKVIQKSTGTQPLVTNLKIMIECMTDPTSSQCASLYRSDSLSLYLAISTRLLQVL